MSFADSATFSGLGIGFGSTFVFDLSDNGLYAAGRTTGPGTIRRAVRYRIGEGIDFIGDLPGGDTRSAASAVNDLGIVVGTGVPTNQRDTAFLWSPDSGFSPVPDLPDAKGSAATAISANGVIVGNTLFDTSTGEGAVFRSSDAQGVQQILSIASAHAISSDGSVVVGAIGLENPTGYRWDGSTTSISVPGADYTVAVDVSADGSAVVGTGFFPNAPTFGQAFIWRDGAMQLLGSLFPDIPELNGSFAEAVSADGSKVVGSSGTSHFIWDESNGMRDLLIVLTDAGADLTGWRIDSVQGISADGRTLVGNGRNPSGQTEAWYARFGGEVRWINYEGGEFEEGSNWHLGIAPGNADTAIFDLPNSYVVQITSFEPTVTSGLIVNNGTVTFENLTYQTTEAVIGGESGLAPTLILSGHNFNPLTAVIGQAVDTDATVRLTGASTFDGGEGSSLIVGDEGDATLQVDSGYVAASNLVAGRASTGLGTMILDGDDNSLNGGDMTLGESGFGELQLLNGATASHGLVTLGKNADTTAGGIVVVRGFAENALDVSKWDLANTLVVGNHGSGSVTIDDGGQVTSAGGVIGVRKGHADAQGIVEVSGAFIEPSSWKVTNDLIVGQETGEGSLRVDSGAAVTATNLDIGWQADARGVVRVVGEGANVDGEPLHSTLEIADELNVGTSGHGELFISDGASVYAKNVRLGLNFDTNASGFIHLSGHDESIGLPTSLEAEEHIDVGFNGQGHMVIDVGALVQSHIGFIGRQLGNPAAQGIVEILDTSESGERSRWLLTDQLIVGEAGKGTLRIEDGGLASADFVIIASGDTSSGLVQLSGISPLAGETALIAETELVVGDLGTGRLEIQNGAAAVAPDATIGRIARDSEVGRGAVAVSGVGIVEGEPPVPAHLQVSGLLKIGDDGHGSIVVDQGGLVTAGVLVAGSGAVATSQGDIVVDGVDSATETASLLEVDGELALGATGRGTLSVIDGGLVTSLAGSLGAEAGARGQTTIQGRASAVKRSTWRIAEHALVGGAGEGVIEVVGGGIVRAKDFDFGDEPGSVGELHATGSVEDFLFSGIVATGAVNIGGDGIGRAVLDFGYIEADTITVGMLGDVSGDSGYLQANTVVNDGFIAPGLSPGTLTINGNYVQSATGRLEIEIAGLSAGVEFDQLIVTGDAIISGDILLKFIDGFAPQQGQQFAFLAVGGLADLSVATFEIQNLAPGFLFDVAPNAGGIMLTALNNGVFVPEPNGIVLILAFGTLLTSLNRVFTLAAPSCCIWP